jgi:kynurenine formamidase
MKRVKQFTGTIRQRTDPPPRTSVLTRWAPVFSELFTHVGQWGTHVDPPAHFIRGLRTVDQINPKEMILPLVVIDVHEEAAKILITRSPSIA